MLSLLQCAEMNSCILGARGSDDSAWFNLPALARASCAMYSWVNKITVLSS